MQHTGSNLKEGYTFPLIFFFFIYSHVHTLFGSFLHPAPLPHPSPPLLGPSGRSFLEVWGSSGSKGMVCALLCMTGTIKISHFPDVCAFCLR
jgi:hypothetical protein